MSLILGKVPHSKVLIQRACQCLYATGKGAGSGTKSTSEPKPKATPAKKKPTSAPKAAAPKAATEVPLDPTKYNCGEYYSYDKWSFYNLEDPMTKHRTGQPSKFE